MKAPLGVPMFLFSTKVFGGLELGLLLSCQVFWFDDKESLHLAPHAVLRLFGIIGDRAMQPKPPAAEHPACPRCQVRLALTHDRQRNTPFQSQ